MQNDGIGLALKESKIWDIAEEFLNTGWIIYFGNGEQLELLDALLKEDSFFESEKEGENFKELAFTHSVDFTTFYMCLKIIFLKKSNRLKELFSKISAERFENSYAINVIDLEKSKVKIVNTLPHVYKRACKELLGKIGVDFQKGIPLYNF